MTDERMVFSVRGLTVRGVKYNFDTCVIEEGQRYRCRLGSGAIDVFKDDQLVGRVATEASKEFKVWLKETGQIEAVVVGLPTLHETKGVEVPVILVLTGSRECIFRNTRNTIMREILEAEKESLVMEDGDITTNKVFCSAKEEHLDFSIIGMTLRGFHETKRVWVPEKGARFLCSVSHAYSVEVKQDGETIGNVPTQGQKLFRMFIEAEGILHVKVAAYPKRHATKGEEIPVIYEFSANEWTNRLQNIRNMICEDIKKRSQDDETLEFVSTDSELQNEINSSTESQSNNMIDIIDVEEYNANCADKKKNTTEQNSKDLDDVAAQNVKDCIENLVEEPRGKENVSSKALKYEVEKKGKDHPECKVDEAGENPGNIGGGKFLEDLIDELGEGKQSKKTSKIPKKLQLGKRLSDEKVDGSEDKIPKKQKELDTEKFKDVRSSPNIRVTQLLQVVKQKGKSGTSKVSKERTPVKSKSSSASSSGRKTPKGSKLKENTITNYFSPKTSQCATSFDGKADNFNRAKKRLMQENKEEQDKMNKEDNLARQVTEKDLSIIAKSIGSNWELLGPHLIKSFGMAKVDQLKEDHGNAEKRIFYLLLAWSKEAGPDAVLGELFHKMQQPGTSVMIQWRTIAEKLNIDEKEIRACKAGFKNPDQETHSN